MATRGRKPKPTALKVLEGKSGQAPLNENEPIPPRGVSNAILAAAGSQKGMETPCTLP